MNILIKDQNSSINNNTTFEIRIKIFNILNTIVLNQYINIPIQTIGLLIL